MTQATILTISMAGASAKGTATGFSTRSRMAVPDKSKWTSPASSCAANLVASDSSVSKSDSAMV